tara:strand:+ start:203 stop:373 length:171 start_codon:yes stop_codon:yes gene_type:complete
MEMEILVSCTSCQGDLTPITIPVCWALAMDNGEGVQPPESTLLGMRGALPYNGGPR